MTIAVLPFNAASGTKHPLARQLANLLAEILRRHTAEEIGTVNYLVRLDDNPTPRMAHINPTETLNEPDLIKQFFDQAQADLLIDGLLQTHDGGGELTVRLFKRDNETALYEGNLPYLKPGLFTSLRQVLEELTEGARIPLETPFPASDAELFGTQNPEAFLKFLEGYDALHYVDQTQGQVSIDFTPEPGIQLLQEAIELDPEWDAPLGSLLQLCRACITFRIGNAELFENTLKVLAERYPKDPRSFFALGDLYQAMGDLMRASDQFEKAHALEPEEPSILTRLGLVQMELGMPVNAERSFRKAVDLEGDDKRSLGLLAAVLDHTGRAHEVPALWKEELDKHPDDPMLHVNFAMSQIKAGSTEEGERAFELALERLEENTPVKRYFAPYLAQKGELDRAMDYFEDCLDATPTDPGLLMEYAQTLQAAGRDFEIPKVLRDLLACNPDPNTTAQAQAWLIELEQPNRADAVRSASEKLDKGDPQGALTELKPLSNWLADYWKMWAVMSAAYNRLEMGVEAEEAAKRLISLFPGCEPGYGELVQALSSQGKHEEAYQAMRFAASNVAGSLSIAVNLALAAKRAGHEQEARQLARQVREAVGPNEELEKVLAEVEV